MTRYFAFLRGINVGGHTVKMDRLRGVFEAGGFERVETFLASGNVIFEAAPHDAGALEDQVEAALRAELGYEVATFVRTDAELGRVAQRIAGREAQLLAGDSMYVSFLRAAPPAAVRRSVEARSNDVDQLWVEGRELYWRIRGKMMDSTLGSDAGGKALGVTTTRNITTVQRLAAKYLS